MLFEKGASEPVRAPAGRRLVLSAHPGGDKPLPLHWLDGYHMGPICLIQSALVPLSDGCPHGVACGVGLGSLTGFDRIYMIGVSVECGLGFWGWGLGKCAPPDESGADTVAFLCSREERE
jgi:hypothetical protein